MSPRKSTAGADYALKLGPPILQGLAAAIRLPEHALKSFWTALCRSTWTESVAWREAASGWRPEAPGARRFWEEECSPARLLTLVERLTQEGVLTRRVGVLVAEQLLRGVDKEGRWHGQTP
jgi:hypothetical protein